MTTCIVVSIVWNSSNDLSKSYVLTYWNWDVTELTWEKIQGWQKNITGLTGKFTRLTYESYRVDRGKLQGWLGKFTKFPGLSGESYRANRGMLQVDRGMLQGWHEKVKGLIGEWYRLIGNVIRLTGESYMDSPSWESYRTDRGNLLWRGLFGRHVESIILMSWWYNYMYTLVYVLYCCNWMHFWE